MKYPQPVVEVAKAVKLSLKEKSLSFFKEDDDLISEKRSLCLTNI